VKTDSVCLAVQKMVNVVSEDFNLAMFKLNYLHCTINYAKLPKPWMNVLCLLI